jgi:hypothetical protein
MNADAAPNKNGLIFTRGAPVAVCGAMTTTGEETFGQTRHVNDGHGHKPLVIPTLVMTFSIPDVFR